MNRSNKHKRAGVFVTSLLASVCVTHTLANNGNTLDTPQIISIDNVGVIESTTRSTVKKSASLQHHDKSDEMIAGKPYEYLITFDDEPVPLYQGGIKGLEATNQHMKLMKNKNRFSLDKGAQKIITDSPVVKRYTNFLKDRQKSIMDSIYEIAPAAEKIASLQYAMNGVILIITPEQAEKIAKLNGVIAVERNITVEIETDVGPTLIGAPSIWNGSANEGLSTTGEGIIIGIIDSGINTDHPSFAAVGADGYEHTNPFGSGNYVGDCADIAPELCNDKLIGLYSYADVTDIYDDLSVFPPGLPRVGEDYSGHGSHVASTAGGNVLFDVPVLRPSNSEEGDGIPTGTKLDRLSGVAPHANVIAYQVCEPGAPGDTYASCGLATSVMAIEDAIKDGVDVLNYSISSPRGNPWNLAVERAFLSARSAGIFVATSAGNSGRSGTNKAAPWYTAVAASEHGRTFGARKTLEQLSGGEFALEALGGQGLGQAISGKLVYAGNFENPNETDGDVATCSEPFPKGTFDNSIVLCNRGDGPRVFKGENVEAGGASGIVLVNTVDTVTTLNADRFSIPGIHLTLEDGNLLKQWLTVGSDHEIAISASTATEKFNPDRVDAIAEFSSRGPNREISTLAPTVTAPGVQIYAAFADQHYGRNSTAPGPSDFTAISGTSMASPHVAGSAALLKAIHPAWTPDNIRSALAMTAERTITLEDGNTAADPLVMGSGRIRVDLAAQAGLVMDESDSNYGSANPAEGGDEKTLNLPSMTDAECVTSCSWTRIVTATKDGLWNVNAQNSSKEINVTVSPAQFELLEGQSQEITVNLRFNTALTGVADWKFGDVELVSSNGSVLHMPISVKQGEIEVPDLINITTRRTVDSEVVTGFKIGSPADIEISSNTDAAREVFTSLSADSQNDTLFDDIEDGVLIIPIQVLETTQRIVLSVLDTTASAYSLHLIRDENGNRLPEESEILQTVESGNGSGRIDTTQPEIGDYWLVIHNRGFFEDGAENDFLLEAAFIDERQDSVLRVQNATANSGGSTDLRFVWELPAGRQRVNYYGVVSVDSIISGENKPFAAIPLNIQKLEDDVAITTEQVDRISKGQTVDYSMTVQPNLRREDREYNIVLQLPEGIFVDNATLPDNAVYSFFDRSITWNLTQSSNLANLASYRFSSNKDDVQCKTPQRLGFDGGYIALSELGREPISTTNETQGLFFAFDFNVPFLGRTETETGEPYFLSFYENGLISVDTFERALVFNASGSAQIPREMPNSSLADGLIAPFWRDLRIDRDRGGNMYFGTTSDLSFAIIEWDRMVFDAEDHGLEGANDTVSIQATINRFPLEGEPDFVFAYRDVQHELGNQAPVVVGYESLSGEEGKMFTYSDGQSVIGDVVTDIVDGRFICMYLEEASQLEKLPFTVTVTEAYEGGDIEFEAFSEVVGDEFTAVEPVSTIDVVEIESAPVATINGRSFYFAGFSDEITLIGDANDLNNDPITYSWTQVSGPEIVIEDSESSTLTIKAPNVSAPKFINIELEVSDGRGNTSVATANLVVRPSF